MARRSDRLAKPLADIVGDPHAMLIESRRLTDKMAATRTEWNAGRGNDYGTAQDFIISQNRRRVIVAGLRGMFRVVHSK